MTSLIYSLVRLNIIINSYLFLLFWEVATDSSCYGDSGVLVSVARCF